jgi:rSAM/selenodomain-associated transferase 1
MHLCVIAKEPRPGFAKTRLTPPCTPEQAARIAEASLADTLETIRRTPACRRTVVLDGKVGPWLPKEFTVVDQVDGGLDRRLSAAFDQCFAATPDDPVVLIGMDTPQVRSADLIHAGEHLHRGSDAVLGPAADGGYWLIGLRSPVVHAFTGVPMSESFTGAAQRSRLQALGCTIETVSTLDDVDDYDTATRVAYENPHGRFASAVREATILHPGVSRTAATSLVDR